KTGAAIRFMFWRPKLAKTELKRLAARPVERPQDLALDLAMAFAAFFAESHELLELLFGEALFFGRALDLDDFARRGQGEVHDGFGRGIYGIIQVEHGHDIHDAHRNSRDELAHRKHGCRRHFADFAQMAKSQTHRHEGARDAR